MTGRSALALLAAAALTVVALGAGSNGTLAAFTDQATVRAGTTATTAFTSGSVATPVTPTVTQPSAGAQVTVTWTSTAVTTGAGDITATSYDVLRYPTAAGGSPTTVCSAVPALSCSFAPTAGTFHYAVLARFEAWTKEGNRQSFSATMAPPLAVTISAPGNTNGDATFIRNSITCGDVPGCGTSTSATAVTYTLRRSNPGGQCWNGSIWVNAPTCSFAAVDGLTSWTIPGTKTVAYVNGNPGRGDFVLTVRAVDGSGGQVTVTSTFTIS